MLLALASVLSLARPAPAEDIVPLRQFDHQAWSLRDGAPSDIFSIAQTTDGYLWLGTANGLFRFDGVRFEEYVPPGNQHLVERSVESLTATPDGGLWIGYTLGYTSFLKSGRLQNFTNAIKDRGGTVFGMVVDNDKSVWAATLEGPEHFFDGAWHGVYKEEGFDSGGSTRVFIDGTGSVWIGTSDYLYRRPPGSKYFHRTLINAGENNVFVEGHDRDLWIGDDKGVFAVDETNPETLTRHYVAEIKYVHDLRFDNSGGLWITDSKTGIYRIAHPQLTASTLPTSGLEHFTSPDGLTSQFIDVSFKDREGSVWVGSTDGLRRFRAMALEPAALPSSFGFYGIAAASGKSVFVGTESDGLQLYDDGKLSRVSGIKAARLTCLYQALDGKLWLGGVDQLGYLEHGRFVEIPSPPEFHAHRDIQAMTVGADGDLWIQDVSRSPILRWNGKVWYPVPPLAKNVGPAVTMITDHRGRVWASYMQGVLAIYDGKQTRELFPRDGVTVGNATALYESDNNVWVGGERGLEVFVNDHPFQVNFDGPTQVIGISGILHLSDGSLWLNSLNGVVRIGPEEVQHLLREPGYAVRFSLYNYLDGLVSKAPQLRPMPSLVEGRDGRIWATTTDGAVSFDPRGMSRNSEVPPVDISLVKGDGKSYIPSNSFSLPKGTRNVEIDYTALSMAIPERVRFKYKLEGFDREWQDAGTRRQAFYTNLSPKTYGFHVIASNNDGVWNEVGATTRFRLEPAFYQTLWFKTILALMILGTILLLVTVRLRFMAFQMRERWRVRLDERERIARELHDTFLQGIQGVLLRVRTATRRVEAGNSARADLEEALLQSNEVMVTGRGLVQDLRSAIRPHGVLAELEAVGRELQGLYSTAFETSVSGPVRDLLPRAQEELCKIGREAIANAFIHAGASLIKVELAYGTQDLRLSIQDDGVGISQEIMEMGRPGHWGIPGIRERVKNLQGKLRFQSAPREGTTLDVWIKGRAAFVDSAIRLPWWIRASWREEEDG